MTFRLILIIWASLGCYRLVYAQDRTPAHLRPANLGDVSLRIYDFDAQWIELGIYVRIEGRYQRRFDKLESDTFTMAGLPQGKYELTLVDQVDSVLLRHSIRVEKQKTLKLEIALFNRGNQIAQEDGNKPGLKQFFIPKATFWQFADGTRRYWHSGQSLEITHDATARWYPDDNDDFLDDREDPRRKQTQTKDRKSLFLGDVQVPFITGLSFSIGVSKVQAWEPLTHCIKKPLEAGGLLVLRPELHAAGGSAVTQVNVLVKSPSSGDIPLKLHDDGSLLDIDPTMPGFQSSADRFASDGQYSLILPLSVPMIKALSHAVLEFSAQNSVGKWSQTVSCHMPAAEAPAILEGDSEPGIDVRVNGHTVFLETTEAMQVNLLSEKEVRSLYPKKKTLNLFTYSDSFTSPIAGGIFLTALSASGSLYYAAWPFAK